MPHWNNHSRNVVEKLRRLYTNSMLGASGAPSRCSCCSDIDQQATFDVLLHAAARQPGELVRPRAPTRRVRHGRVRARTARVRGAKGRAQPLARVHAARGRMSTTSNLVGCVLLHVRSAEMLRCAADLEPGDREVCPFLARAIYSSCGTSAPFFGRCDAEQAWQVVRRFISHIPAPSPVAKAREPKREQPQDWHSIRMRAERRALSV